MKKDKHFGITVETEMHYKIHYIAKYEGRSATGQILYFLRKAISDRRSFSYSGSPGCKSFRGLYVAGFSSVIGIFRILSISISWLSSRLFLSGSAANDHPTELIK